MKVGVFGCMPKQLAHVRPPRGVELVYLGGRHHPLCRFPRLDLVIINTRWAGHRDAETVERHYGTSKVHLINGGLATITEKLEALAPQ